MALRGAVLGVGMIGRHHVRLLQSSARMELAGAVDQAGDRFGAIADPALLFETVDDLLAAGPIDFAIVALPTDEHMAAADRLAREGIHLLIEKPLAATSAEARAIIDVCAETGVRAAVGHVERFNPALQEMRRRVLDGQLGEIFLVNTERNGPFPERVRDVGVVKDLATHDLDIVRWLCDAPIASVAAQASHRMGREHEDIVSITGRLAGGIVFNSLVDWLTPAKVRQTRVVGDRGMLVADTLTADLTFYENGTVSSQWDRSLDLRGVSEGDMTRYALARREPLLLELEAFCDLVEGRDGAGSVTLEEGLEVVRSAKAVLESASTGQAVAVGVTA